MVYAPRKHRPAWQDRFRRPTVDELRSSFDPQVGGLLEQARERLRGLDGVVERVEWLGLPWRWTLTYVVSDAEQDRAFAYIVPDPERPQISLPLTADVLEHIDNRKLSKPVRDGIAAGRRVAGVCWAVWPLTSRSQLDDVLQLARLKRRRAEESA